jgi:hypothetical protein
MLAEVGGGFAVVGGLGDRCAMARRVLAGAGQTPNLSRAGALRNGRSHGAGLAEVGRWFFAQAVWAIVLWPAIPNSE